MASTSSNLEQGYEKLLRYCSNEFRQIGRDSQLEVNDGLRESVSRMRKRPELLTLVAFVSQHSSIHSPRLTARL
jgi:conserved oligomeric Golgi complex subunit 6